MDMNRDENSLREVLAILDRLDSGWLPGNSELDGARCIENWTILSSKNGAPFKLIGPSRTPLLSHCLFISNVFAMNADAHWARTLDEWLVIGDPADGARAYDARDLQRTGIAWLLSQLECSSAHA